MFGFLLYRDNSVDGQNCNFRINLSHLNWFVNHYYNKTKNSTQQNVSGIVLIMPVVTSDRVELLPRAVVVAGGRRRVKQQMIKNKL